MRYIITIIVLYLVALFTLNVPLASAQGNEPASSSATMSSYELFWPLSAGKVMGDSLYWLKSLKESFRGFLIFGDKNKAEYNFELSTKRLLEAEKLYNNKDFENGKKTLELSQKLKKDAFNNLRDLKEKKKSSQLLEDRFSDILDRQKTLLQFMISRVDESQKGDIEAGISQINNFLSGD